MRGRALAQQRDEAFLRHRLSEQEALTEVAAHSDQGDGICGLFDAHGDGGATEIMREVDDCLAERRDDLVDAAVGDETAIELELGKGQFAKPRQRRVGFRAGQLLLAQIDFRLIPEFDPFIVECFVEVDTGGDRCRFIAQGAVDASNLRVAAKPKLDMRKQMIAVLRRVTTGSAPGMAASAARHGLELTRPFHDKRVVELALAIPQELYVKNGRNRYLACAALKDIYPREFQNRWRMNDDEIPDFQRMAKSIEPQLLAEIARMEKSEKLSSYIDFAKIRRLLAARGPDDHNSGWEQETQLALGGFMTARYVEWFRRSNG